MEDLILDVTIVNGITGEITHDELMDIETIAFHQEESDIVLFKNKSDEELFYEFVNML